MRRRGDGSRKMDSKLARMKFPIPSSLWKSEINAEKTEEMPHTLEALKAEDSVKVRKRRTPTAPCCRLIIIVIVLLFVDGGDAVVGFVLVLVFLCGLNTLFEKRKQSKKPTLPQVTPEPLLPRFSLSPTIQPT